MRPRASSAASRCGCSSSTAIADLANETRHAAYKQAIDKALIADFDDVELWLIRGNAEEPTAAGRGQRGFAASVAFYLQALKVAPGNGAANHYLTHSFENLNRIDDALKHGEVYASLAPDVPHARHMWGHDLRRVGRLDEAIAAFSRTDELEKAYYSQEKIPAGLDWHHVHNLDLLATSYEHKGQMRRAEQLLREAASIPPVTEYQSFNQKSLTVFLLGRQRWKEALATTKPLIANNGAATRVVGHAFAGHAYLGLRDFDSARGALEAAKRELEQVPTLTSGIRVNRAGVVPYVDALRAELMLWEGNDNGAGAELLMDVQRRLRALPGPDAWTQALFRLEAFARTARAVGDWKLAEYTARQMLEHDAAYGGSHLALALVAQQRGNHELVGEEVTAARKFWRDADRNLRELAELRKLENQRGGGSELANAPPLTRAPRMAARVAAELLLGGFACRGLLVGAVDFGSLDEAVTVHVVARKLRAHVRIRRGLCLRNLPVSVRVERFEGGAFLRWLRRRLRHGARDGQQCRNGTSNH